MCMFANFPLRCVTALSVVYRRVYTCTYMYFEVVTKSCKGFRLGQGMYHFFACCLV